MRRRTFFTAALTAFTHTAGCGAPEMESRTPPGDTSPNTQFQYDAQHTGKSDTRAPEAVKRRWRSRVSPITGGLAVAEEHVLVATGGSLISLDIDNGDERWSADVGHDIDAAPALTDDTAYVTAWSGGEPIEKGVAAIDLADGSERWRALPDLGISSAVTLANDTVYVGGSLTNSHVIALDAVDGEELWRAQVGTHVPTPAVSGELIYVGGGSEAIVCAFDTATGDERWHVDVDDRVWGAPTVIDEMVYVGTRAGTVYALGTEDGEKRWRVEVGNDVRASLAVTSEAIYVPQKGAISALSIDGDKRWSTDMAGHVFAPTVAGDSIVVTDNTQTYCFDASDGTEHWRLGVQTRGISDMVFTGIRCAPVVHEGTVYIGSHGGDVSAFQSLT